ncbi:MAG TPA: arylesterase [Novosphingobium sp.]|nr:arylesterase [Novosphingobium sp.]
MVVALLLSGCGGEAAPPAAKPTSSIEAPRPPAGPEKLVVAFGDSLYAGYGLKPGEAWPARLEKALWARGINAHVVNAGVSGDTTAAGRQRLGFILDSQPRAPELVIVGLGGNDMLRGLPPAQARANLEAILAELDRRKIPAMLTGMLAAPNMGEAYAREFNAIYPALAQRHDAALVPFFMAAVVGDPRLFQPDHVHPTAAGVDRIVAATVDEVAGALKR